MSEYTFFGNQSHDFAITLLNCLTTLFSKIRGQVHSSHSVSNSPHSIRSKRPTRWQTAGQCGYNSATCDVLLWLVHMTQLLSGNTMIFYFTSEIVARLRLQRKCVDILACQIQERGTKLCINSYLIISLRRSGRLVWWWLWRTSVAKNLPALNNKKDLREKPQELWHRAVPLVFPDIKLLWEQWHPIAYWRQLEINVRTSGRQTTCSSKN